MTVFATRPAAPTAPPPPAEGLPPERRRAAILAVGSALALSTVSLSSVSVALPQIARDLSLPPATTIWLVSGFQLVLLATLFPFAALGERWGYRRTFLSGLALIAVASAVCTFAPSFEVLLAGRLVQGIGASAVMAVNPALMRLSVPASMLGRTLGIGAMIVATFTALGPSLAALVLSVADWTWLFLLNLPWAIVAFGVGVGALPENPLAAMRRFDGVGALLNVVAFVLIASGLDGLASHGVAALLPLGAGLACGVALVLHQKRKAAPLLPLDLLGHPVVRRCVAASVFAFASQMAAMVSLPFLLHDVNGRDMLTTGLMMMAWPLAVALMAPLSGWLEDCGAAAWSMCAGGGVVMAASLCAIALLPRGAGNLALAGAMVVCGIGFGFFQTPNNRAMLGATPRERSGGAGGLQATARLTGQVLGASTVGVAYRLAPSDAISAVTGALIAAATFAALSAVISARRSAGRGPALSARDQSAA